MNTPVETKASLLQQLTDNGIAIRSFGVKDMRLFGSFAKDKYINETSDVDLLVDFEVGKKTWDNFIDLSFYLEDLLGRKVELVTTQSLSKYIGPHILREAQSVPI
jgi:predicted nucleotidyltransferase